MVIFMLPKARNYQKNLLSNMFEEFIARHLIKVIWSFGHLIGRLVGRLGRSVNRVLFGLIWIDPASGLYRTKPNRREPDRRTKPKRTESKRTKPKRIGFNHIRLDRRNDRITK